MESEPQSPAILLRDTLNKVIEAIHDEELHILIPQAKIAGAPREKLACLRNILQHAWMRKSSDTPELLLILATAARERRLRASFGEISIRNRIRKNRYSHDPIVLENAVRLVSNCVADTNFNRKLALERNVIKNLLRLAKEGRSVDFIIPALYNLCVEYESDGETAEAGDSAVLRANAAQVELAHSDADIGVVRALFAMSRYIRSDSDQRKPLLAGLIEMVSLTAPEDLLCVGISSDMEPQHRRRAAYETVLMFLGPSSILLTSCDSDATVSMCNALLNVLAAPELKQVLLAERQLQPLANFHHTVETLEQDLLGDVDGEESLASLRQCGKALLKEFYILSGLPEFTVAYTLSPGSPGSDFIQVCIERPRNAEFWTYSPTYGAPSIAIAYTVLANLITSEKDAMELVHTYHVHEPIQAILSDLDDADSLYPALGLLSRLSLPSANKQEIVGCGMLSALRRFLSRPTGESAIDWKPALRIEALTALRRLISGQVGTLASLQEATDPGSYMRDILDFFTTCKDTSTKIEVGRLCVEHFRTISSRKRTDQTSSPSDQITYQNNLAEPMAFLACEGPSPGAMAEGWFGLGLMTAWDKTRAQVLELMKTPRMMEEVGKVADADSSLERASTDNLKVVLSKLDFGQGTTDIDRHARDVFASAKLKLGL